MFPGLVDCIMQLPFVEIGAVGLLKQLKEIEPHVDTFDPTMPTEPRRYLVLLTPPAENTFYILKNDIPEVVPVHPDYRAFAFNSTDTTHGAIAPSGIKILMSVVGILDHDAHAALITRSMDKFKEWTIFL